jgi:hypothetical protein
MGVNFDVSVLEKEKLRMLENQRWKTKFFTQEEVTKGERDAYVFYCAPGMRMMKKL